MQTKCTIKKKLEIQNEVGGEEKTVLNFLQCFKLKKLYTTNESCFGKIEEPVNTWTPLIALTLQRFKKLIVKSMSRLTRKIRALEASFIDTISMISVGEACFTPICSHGNCAHIYDRLYLKVNQNKCQDTIFSLQRPNANASSSCNANSFFSYHLREYSRTYK